MKKVIIVLFIFMFYFYEDKKVDSIMINLLDKKLVEVENFINSNDINLIIEEDYSNYEKGKIFYQSTPEGKIIEDNLTVKISKGIDYNNLKIDESLNIPVMMYHGIYDKENEYTGGNIDYAGYHRTASSFKEDLEFYYNSGYRMIRLEDYVNGVIDVEIGCSPIVLTFDDGLSNNIKVLGKDSNGELIIDPLSAVGILEEFKNKYPDYNVTATFFLNGGLFNQSEYNEDILNWLIDNNYDIGNHSYSHQNLSKLSLNSVYYEIGKQYELLNSYIGDKYVNIVSLPFGIPYSKSDNNFKHIINTIYNNVDYKTISTLRVGWEADYSPFNKLFDQQFIKRIRAYDNNGLDFDIEMNFKILENKKYISDGNINTVTVPKDKVDTITTDLEVITY